jgi:AcrR family transcriptional regulator
MATTSKSPTTPKTRTPTLDIEQTVIDAATHLMATEGAEALSIRRIAEAADVSPQSVYNRFGSKRGVIDALFVTGFTLLNAALDVHRSGDVEIDLVNCGRRYRAFALENPALYAIMFSKAVVDYEPSAEAADKATASFQQLVQHMAWYLDQGVLIDGDAVEISQRIWSASHGAMSLELAGIGFVEGRAAHMDNLSRTMARGLLNPTRSVNPTTLTPSARARSRHG